MLVLGVLTMVQVCVAIRYFYKHTQQELVKAMGRFILFCTNFVPAVASPMLLWAHGYFH
jgi:hypothetical protein